MRINDGPEVGMANDAATRDRSEERNKGVLAAAFAGGAASAAQPAVITVTRAYLARIRPGDGVVDRNFRIGSVVQDALQAGVPARDAAMGAMLGVLRAAPAVEVDGTAAAVVLLATSYYGGRVHEAIAGILAAVILRAEERGEDGAEAVSEVTRGILAALRHDVTADASFEL